MTSLEIPDIHDAARDRREPDARPSGERHRASGGQKRLLSDPNYRALYERGSRRTVSGHRSISSSVCCPGGV